MKKNCDYFDCKIKWFDDTHFQVTTYSYRNKYNFEKEKENELEQFEQLQFELKEEKTLNECISDIKRSVISSRNRAKNMIYDYARSNVFDYFVTLTFNPDLVDSFDYSECSQKLSKWLNNFRSRYAPGVKYLFVPELHKSGRYHFHGIMADIGDMKLVDSGKKTPNGETIYNIGNYKLGFTTATKITDRFRTATYIGKYITKELSGHIRGKKHYWVSRNLDLPVVENISLEQLNNMGIDREFLENNSSYSKSVEYELGDTTRKVSYYEFEKGV